MLKLSDEILERFSGTFVATKALLEHTPELLLTEEMAVKAVRWEKDWGALEWLLDHISNFEVTAAISESCLGDSFEREDVLELEKTLQCF